PLASSTKFLTVFGAWFGKSRTSMLPWLVFRVALSCSATMCLPLSFGDGPILARTGPSVVRRPLTGHDCADRVAEKTGECSPRRGHGAAIRGIVDHKPLNDRFIRYRNRSTAPAPVCPSAHARRPRAMH